MCELVLQPWTGDQNAYVSGEAKKKKKSFVEGEGERKERENNKKIRKCMKVHYSKNLFLKHLLEKQNGP